MGIENQNRGPVAVQDSLTCAVGNCSHIITMVSSLIGSAATVALG